MLSDKASLDARVGWIRQEVEQQLTTIKDNLAEYISNDDIALVEKCRDEMLEIEKTMNVTGVQGGETLAQEIHKSLAALAAHEVNDTQATLEVLDKAVVQMSEYLQHLQDGYADLPIVILPLLNELRAVRGEDLLSELLVFLPEEGSIGNAQIGIDEYVTLSDDKRTKVYQHLRLHFQKSLVTWFKDDQSESALKTIQAITTDLIRIHKTMDLRTFWWVAKALVQAVQQGKLEQGSAVKLLIASLERQMLNESQMGVDEVGESPELAELKKNFLYYVGLADNGSPLADAVKEAYMLDIYLPQGESLDKLTKHYASPGQQLWRTVSDNVNEDIQSIMEGFESMELNPNEGIMQFIIDKSRRTATTLSMLGLGRLAVIIDNQVDEFNILINNPKGFTEERRIEVATEWLRVKDILEQYAETGEDATAVLFTESEGYQVSDYNAKKGVLTIIEKDLEAAIQHLDAYEKEPDVSHFQAAKSSLLTVDNTLGFIRVSELQILSKSAIHYIEKPLEDNTEKPKEELTILAELLAALESSIVSLRSHSDHTMVLEQGYKSVLELHAMSPLYDGIESEIESVRSEATTIKKQIRQNKMEAILTA